MNRNKTQAASSTIDSDWFTEQNIDCSQSELTRNITSKSIILAPFNSTLTNKSEFKASFENLLEERKAIKLGAKVREVDRQYEKNNNCEVDNGVYNKFAFDSKCQDPNNLNPLASNEDSNDEDQQCAEHKKHGSSSSRAELSAKTPGNDNVQKMLLNSLAPHPVVISKPFIILMNY